VRRDGKSYGLGEIIRLPAEEASRQQALGFLASSTAPATSVGVEPVKVVTSGWRIGIDWNRPVIAPTVGIFGDQVDHQPAYGAAFPITGVFDEAFIELTPHGPGGIDTENFVIAYPTASASRCRCSASSSPSSWEAAARRPPTLISGPESGRRFVVKEVRPDSHGDARLLLNDV
jgi:hypothetical protein